ncbi:MAG: QueT transporter family protein [bacterium]|nr:QueT transporter family protein [bacterium]
MKELITMWKNTRMIVLTAVIAAIYAAVLIPFKIFTIIPGYTEIRPAAVIPIVCSLMFGPAAAFGASFGNLIGDFFGTLGLGSLFGLIGNFLYGYIPYKVFRKGILEPDFRKGRFLLITLIASLVCGVTIGYGLDILGLLPFAAFTNIVILNNFILSAILGPLLLIPLYPRVKRWGFLYQEIMEEGKLSCSRFHTIGILLLVIGIIYGFVVGNIISFGIHKSPLLTKTIGDMFGKHTGLGLEMLPAMILIIIGTSLL